MFGHKMSSIRPLDIILFKGDDAFSSTIMNIERMLGYTGDFSHVAIVVTKEILPWFSKLKDERLYIWESTCSWTRFTDGNPDVLTGKTKLGVQVRDLEKVKRRYLHGSNTSMVHCSLSNNPTNYNLRRTIDIMGSLYFKYASKSYESPLGLGAAVSPTIMKIYSKLPKRDTNDDLNSQFNGDRLFCSELVALVYQKLGLIDRTVNPSSVLPCFFLERTNLFGYNTPIYPEIKCDRKIKEEKEDNNIMSLKIEYRLS